MRELAILEFVTLDGVMQAPSVPDEDPTGGFTHGGWARRCWDEVMEQVLGEAMADPYDLLLGRNTYELFAASFSGAGEENPVAQRLNDATEYVVTSGVEGLDWKNTVKLGGDVPGEVSRLKEQEGPLLQVHGSWQLVQALLSTELIDEFRLWTFPEIVGTGKRLFEKGAVPAGLTLKKADSTPAGATMSLYRRA